MAALERGESLQLELPGGGRLHMDRPLPFLAIWRARGTPEDRIHRRLVSAEAAYMQIAAEDDTWEPLLQALIRWGADRYGSFLLVEVAAEPVAVHPPDGVSPRPFCRIRAPEAPVPGPAVEAMEKGLRRIRVLKEQAAVTVETAPAPAPPHLPPLVSRRRLTACGAHLIVLTIAPIYLDPGSGAVFPLVLRRLRRGVSRALKRAFFSFMTAQPHAPYRPPHYLALGRRALVHAVWEVDRRLSEVSNAFDFLLQVTPVNSAPAWLAFKRSRYQKAPVFTYRPLPEDPVVLKRRLYDVAVERVEDPTLENLFREKQADLDRKITMMQERESSRFLFASLQLYGGISAQLMETARELLRRIPPKSQETLPRGICPVGLFVRRAEEEIAAYRARLDTFTARVEVRDDVPAGLMVSRGNLLVSREARVPESRVEALLQHEVGTHLLTYYNARTQPLRLLASGLAGYEELQEGQAVLAEVLVGGLSRPRLRLLAARVAAVGALLDGANFVETFRLLHREHGFDARAAFTIALRVHRGGGLTKDAVYLRGLDRVLTFLADGGEMRLLFVGKIAIKHVPMIQELLWRKVLHPPPLMPRYVEEPAAIRRLDALRSRPSVLDLLPAGKK